MAQGSIIKAFWVPDLALLGNPARKRGGASDLNLGFTLNPKRQGFGLGANLRVTGLVCTKMQEVGQCLAVYVYVSESLSS